MDFEMDNVLKLIYTSCDPEETNQVPASKLIEFICPYLADEAIVSVLRSDLDSENQDILLTREQFYENMLKWAKKVGKSQDEAEEQFNETPSQLSEIDEKDLPFVQSTPRASFGQKLLSCEELINLSQLTARNNDDSFIRLSKAMLEEENKRMEHQLKQVHAEMDMMKSQILATEEQNDSLQKELTTCRTRLANEQQLVAVLQKDKYQSDELKEELSLKNSEIEKCNAKIHQYEKDTSTMKSYIKQLESERTSLTERCEELNSREQKLLREVFDIKTELVTKEEEISVLTKLNAELKQKVKEEKQIIDDLEQEKDLLDYKKTSLERRLSSRRYSSFSPSRRNTSIQGTKSPYFVPSSVTTDIRSYNSPTFLKKLGSPVSPCLDSPLYSFNDSNSLSTTPKTAIPYPKKSNIQDYSYEEEFSFGEHSDTSNNSARQQMSLEMELRQSGQLSLSKKEDDLEENKLEDESHSLEIEKLKDKLNDVTIENEKLQLSMTEANKTIEFLSKKVDIHLKEKQQYSEKIEALEKEKADLESRIKHMETRYPDLLHKNHDKIQELEDSLSKVNKEYANLQTKYNIQENELLSMKNKFNFETAYKNIQIELAQKNKDLEELRENNSNYKSLIQKLTNTNLELNKKLEEKELAVLNYQSKLMKLNENEENCQQTTTQTKSQLQQKEEKIINLISLNKDYKDKIRQLENELQSKSAELTQMRTLQKEDMSIKNTMWKNYRDLKIKMESLKKTLDDNENSKQELQVEYNKLSSTYNNEVKKNSELCQQISQHKEEMCEVTIKIERENEKNAILSSQLEQVQKEMEHIKHNLTKTYNELKEYEDKNHILKSDLELAKEKISQYEMKIKESENLNANSKIELNKAIEKMVEGEYELENLVEKIRELEILNDGLKNDLITTKEKLTEYEMLLATSNNKLKELENINVVLNMDLETRKRSEESVKNVQSTSNPILTDIKFGKRDTKDSKSCSFEKQLKIIEKLRSRVKDLEVDVENERSRNKVLQSEKEKIIENYLKLQNDIYSLQNDKDSALNSLTETNDKLLKALCKIDEFREQHKLELERRDNLLNHQKQIIEFNSFSSQKQNKSIQDLNLEICKKNTDLKNLLCDNNNLRCQYENSEKKMQELALTVYELEKELNKQAQQIVALTDEITEKNSANEKLHDKIVQCDEKIADLYLELSEKESRYLVLLEEKENLQEKLSGTDNHKQLQLITSEEKKQNSEERLQILETETGITTRFLGESIKDGKHLNVISDCNKQLSRVLAMVLKNWQTEMQRDGLYKCISPLEDNYSDIEDCLYSLAEKIMLTVSIMEFLSTKASMANAQHMDDASSAGHGKTLQKFTLRPARLIIGRPVSPDSPSLGVVEECGDVYKSSHITDSPDSRMVEINESADDLIDDVFIEDTISASQLFSPLSLSFDDAFPHLTDCFLQKIGLLEDGTKQALSSPEIERVFATFAIQIALDSTDIKERLENQKETCEKEHRRLLHLMKDISMRLREHKCIGAMDSIKPVFVLLEDVRYLLREIMQASGQYGILSCEYRMMRCWNMVTNYMAFLKKENPNSSIKRKQLIDKQINTVQPPENFVLTQGEQSELTNEKSDSKSMSENVDQVTKDMEGYRGNGFFSVCKRLTMWLVVIVFSIFLGLVSIHWQCQKSTEHQMCPLDSVIQKINIGTPPY